LAWTPEWTLADLNEVRVAVEAEDTASGGGDVLGRPRGGVKDVDGRVGDGLESREPIGNLGAEVGFGGVGSMSSDQIDVHDMLLRKARDDETLRRRRY
jgi:hypothetical protein